jgi:predicted  nucleic acid-binding Zn-ribbon protein
LENSDFEHRMTEVEQRSKSNSHRLDAVEKRQDDLDALVSSIAEVRKDQEYIQKDVETIKKDVKTLTEKPGKRWDGIVDKLIWAVLAAVLGFLLARLGL